MGYRIVYGPQRQKGDTACTRGTRWRVFAAAFLIAAVLGVKCAWGAIRRDMSQSAAIGALCTLTEQVRGGEPVGEAVMTFCKEILESAQKE